MINSLYFLIDKAATIAYTADRRSVLEINGAESKTARLETSKARALKQAKVEGLKVQAFDCRTGQVLDITK